MANTQKRSLQCDFKKIRQTFVDDAENENSKSRKIGGMIATKETNRTKYQL